MCIRDRVIITIVALATRAYLNFEQELQWETHQQGNGKIKVDAGLFSYEVDEKTYFKNWGRFEFMIELLLALLWLFPFILLAYLFIGDPAMRPLSIASLIYAVICAVFFNKYGSIIPIAKWTIIAVLVFAAILGILSVL